MKRVIYLVWKVLTRRHVREQGHCSGWPQASRSRIPKVSQEWQGRDKSRWQMEPAWQRRVSGLMMERCRWRAGVAAPGHSGTTLFQSQLCPWWSAIDLGGKKCGRRAGWYRWGGAPQHLLGANSLVTATLLRAGGILMGIRLCGGVLIYFLHGDHRENTAAAAASLNILLFLMFSVHMQFERFQHQCS